MGTEVTPDFEGCNAVAFGTLLFLSSIVIITVFFQYYPQNALIQIRLV